MVKRPSYPRDGFDPDAVDDLDAVDEDYGDEEDDDEHTVVAASPTTGRLPELRQRRAYLIVLAGANAGAVFRIEQHECVMGRSAKCEITINDTGISRKHATLTLVSDTEMQLRDLRSTNGTYVENQRIENAILHDGDRFQLGNTTLLKFSVSDEVEESFQRRLYESSVRDGLTGLNNRKHFDERLEGEFRFAQRHGSAVSLILIDIDHFKRVNDTYGHRAGDQVLRHVAGVLKDNCRAEDVVARYGGEEFAIIARGIGTDQAVRFGNRLRAFIQQAVIETENEKIKITLSAGVATYTGAEFSEPGELVSAADRALYEGKNSGRNLVVLAKECR
jgi:diguanylate cyclase (GGDEF)-like protein